MATVKHTPGPWRYGLIESGAIIRAGEQPFAPAVAFIAETNWANREADAKLISAAPELADQLEEALGILRAIERVDFRPDAVADCIDSSRAALHAAGREVA